MMTLFSSYYFNNFNDTVLLSTQLKTAVKILTRQWKIEFTSYSQTYRVNTKKSHESFIRNKRSDMRIVYYERFWHRKFISENLRYHQL